MLFCRSQNSKCQKKYREAVLGEEKDAGLEGGQKKRRKKDDIKQLPNVSRVQVEEVSWSTSLAVNSGLNLLLYSDMLGFLRPFSPLTCPSGFGRLAAEYRGAGPFPIDLEGLYWFYYHVDQGCSRGAIQVSGKPVFPYSSLSKAASALWLIYLFIFWFVLFFSQARAREHRFHFLLGEWVVRWS